MMKSNKDIFLKLQLFYVLMGGVFNGVSFIVFSNTGRMLTPTDPMSGLIFMMVIGAGIVLVMRQFYWPYLGIMILCLPLTAYGGIVVHILRFSSSEFSSLYYSQSIWGLGIFINLYGLIVGVIGSVSVIRFVFKQRSLSVLKS